MKIKVLAGCALACAALAVSGCAAISPLKVDSALSPDAQLIQAKAKADFDAKLASRLDYCTITGTLSVTAKASPEAGVETSGGFTCQAKPWDQPAGTPTQ